MYELTDVHCTRLAFQKINILNNFDRVTFCPVTFCPCDILSCDILSCDILSCGILSCGILSCAFLSVGRYVLWHFVRGTLCPVAFCPWDVMSCGILSVGRYVLWHFVLGHCVWDILSSDILSYIPILQQHNKMAMINRMEQLLLLIIIRRLMRRKERQRLDFLYRYIYSQLKHFHIGRFEHAVMPGVGRLLSQEIHCPQSCLSSLSRCRHFEFKMAADPKFVSFFFLKHSHGILSMFSKFNANSNFSENYGLKLNRKRNKQYRT